MKEKISGKIRQNFTLKEVIALSKKFLPLKIPTEERNSSQNHR